MNNVLITGHSQNLGKALSEEFAPTHNVIGVSSNELDFLHFDKTPEKYITMEYDFVIINARSRDHYWNDLMNINCVNQIKFVHDLLFRIKKGLIFITSRAASFQRASQGLVSKSQIPYSMSKVSLTMAAVIFSKYTTYPTFAIDPGSFATPVRPNKTLMPEDVARGIKNIIDNDMEKYDGKLVKYTGEVLPW